MYDVWFVSDLYHLYVILMNYSLFIFCCTFIHFNVFTSWLIYINTYKLLCLQGATVIKQFPLGISKVFWLIDSSVAWKQHIAPAGNGCQICLRVFGFCWWIFQLLVICFLGTFYTKMYFSILPLNITFPSKNVHTCCLVFGRDLKLGTEKLNELKVKFEVWCHIKDLRTSKKFTVLVLQTISTIRKKL